MSILRRTAAAAIALVALVGATASAASAHSRPHVKEFKLPADFAVPAAMTIGPDGNLWYVAGDEGKVGRVSRR